MHGKTDGYRDRTQRLVVMGDMQAPHDSENTLSSCGCSLRIGIRQNHDEFLASESTGDVALAGIFVQRLRNAAQYAVAGIMAEGIVEALEMVEVQHQHAESCPISFAARHLPVERLFEKTPVVQSGQRIPDRLLAKILPQADIAQRQCDLLRKRSRQMLPAFHPRGGLHTCGAMICESDPQQPQ